MAIRKRYRRRLSADHGVVIATGRTVAILPSLQCSWSFALLRLRTCRLRRRLRPVCPSTAALDQLPEDVQKRLGRLRAADRPFPFKHKERHARDTQLSRGEVALFHLCVVRIRLEELIGFFDRGEDARGDGLLCEPGARARVALVLKVAGEETFREWKLDVLAALCVGGVEDTVVVVCRGNGSVVYSVLTESAIPIPRSQNDLHSQVDPDLSCPFLHHLLHLCKLFLSKPRLVLFPLVNGFPRQRRVQ